MLLRFTKQKELTSKSDVALVYEHHEAVMILQIGSQILCNSFVYPHVVIICDNLRQGQLIRNDLLT